MPELLPLPVPLPVLPLPVPVELPGAPPVEPGLLLEAELLFPVLPQPGNKKLSKEIRPK